MQLRPFQVRPSGDRWEIRRQGDPQPFSTHDRKQDAVAKALELAAHDRVRLVISEIAIAERTHGPGQSAA
jgi:hypothetical protein